MKTKYIKVSVSDRLPEETETYMTSHGWFTYDHGKFYNDEDEEVPYVNYWLEEIPDREEEMRLLLKESKEKLMDIDWAKYPHCQNTYEKIDSLLQELEKCNTI